MPSNMEDCCTQWESPFRFPYLAWAWKITLPHLLWGLWKIRNDSVFRDQKPLIVVAKRKILAAIKENLKLFKGKTKNPCPKWEQEVLDKFTYSPVKIKSPGKNVYWIRPMGNTIKINFDGASKGNPGQAGGGGILRNSEGDWLFVYAGPLG
ncbi:hypothetical protein KI387_043370, partial [Taxus chinensis]